jgi:hypothetical protein
MSFGRGTSLVPPPHWTDAQLDSDRQFAIDQFRQQRMAEPLEEYLRHFAEVQAVMENLLETTTDLALLSQQALSILTDPDYLDGFRYLAAPPISIDDLKTLTGTNSLAPKTLQNDPDLVERLVQTVRAGLDRRRFPWVSEDREATEADRAAAILATASLMATRRSETARRNEGKQEQEELVRQALFGMGLVEVGVPSGISPLGQNPQPGEFTRETMVGTRKADIVVRLWDRRFLPIECKVSNSSTNSVKRLNNDAAVKASQWIREFGQLAIVPSAMLSGVYKLHNLKYAQDQGLTIFWAHRLTDLTEWIERTRR